VIEFEQNDTKFVEIGQAVNIYGRFNILH